MKKKETVWFIFAILFIVSVASHYQTFFNGFVYDDHFQIVKNQWITSFSYVPEIFSSSVWAFKNEMAALYYRPLMHLVFLFQYQLWELNPVGYHLFNVFFHAVNGLLVFIVLRLLISQGRIKMPAFLKKDSTTLPFLVAILFIFYPISSEVVYWISAIPDLFLLSFSLLAFYFYIRAEKNSNLKKYSYLFFGIGLFMKETIVCLFLFLFFYDLFFKKQQKSLILFSLNWLRNNFIYLIIFFSYYAIRRVALGENSFSFESFLFQNSIFFIDLLFLPLIIFENIFNVIWPFNLAFFHSLNFLERPLFGFFPLVGFLVFVLSWRVIFYQNEKMLKLLRVVLFIFISFAIFLIPASLINLVGNYILSERYLYISSIFYFISLILVLSYFINKTNFKKINKKILLYSVFVLISIPFFITTVKQGQYWKNDKALHLNTIKNQPKASQSHLNLGVRLCSEGNCEECIKHFDLGKSFKVRWNLNYEKNMDYFIGVCYLRRGEEERAGDILVKSAKAGDFASLSSFAVLQARKGRIEKALDNINYALKGNSRSILFNYKAAIINCLNNSEEIALSHIEKIKDVPLIKKVDIRSCEDIIKNENKIIYYYH